MWIIPKTLSHFVPATPGWSLESSERAWMFAQSVTWRSKFMSKQYWLKRFKKGDYVQHLSGLTLSPSMHDRFVESWTESQEASHVSHFQAPENEKDKKTQGTYGQASQTLFDFADPDGSSSKTCQDWLPLGCVTSCKTWDKWVIERRGVYSQRKKLALHTKGNESSSLQNYPTPAARDYKGTNCPHNTEKKIQEGKRAGMGQLPNFVMMQNWATPQASDHIEGARTAKESNQKCLGRDLNQMNWPTPRAGNPGSRKPGTGGKILAEEAKKNWPTARTSDAEGGRIETEMTQEGFRSKRKKSNQYFGAKLRDAVETHEQHNGLQDQEKSNTSGKNQESPKLNPSWVEQLMGLSTEWTDLGSWGMELSPKQQN